MTAKWPPDQERRPAPSDDIEKRNWRLAMANGDMLITQTAWRRLSGKQDSPQDAFDDYVEAAIELMVDRFGDAPFPVPARWPT